MDLVLIESPEVAPSLKVERALSDEGATGGMGESGRSGIRTKSGRPTKRKAMDERKLKSGNCSRAEIREARDLCTQVYQDYDPDNPEWKSAARAERLLENYDLDDET